MSSQYLSVVHWSLEYNGGGQFYLIYFFNVKQLNI